jgi:hypothetical protein
VAKIFISYRREDSKWQAGHIQAKLRSLLPSDEIFYDVDSIFGGANFPQRLERAVAACDYVVVVVGASWLTVTDKNGQPRLNNPNDWVRIELETALGRGIPVIPVLLDNEEMPDRELLPESLREFCERQAVRVRSYPDFEHDVQRISRAIQEHAKEQAAAIARSQSRATTFLPIASQLGKFVGSDGTAGRKLLRLAKRKPTMLLSGLLVVFVSATMLFFLSHAGKTGPIDTQNTKSGVRERATVTAKIARATGDRPAVLLITAQISPGWHTYSLTQPAGGRSPTKIELHPASAFRLLHAFRSQPAPETHLEELSPGNRTKVEEHKDEVTWYVPIELMNGVDPKTLEIRGMLHMQVCETGEVCESVDKEFVAKVATSSDIAIPDVARAPESANGSY